MHFILLLSIVVYELHVPIVVIADCSDDRCLHHRFVNVTNRFNMGVQHQAGGPAAVAKAADREHFKNVGVRLHKFDFVRRIRRDVHQVAALEGQPGGSVFPALESVNADVSPIAIAAEKSSKSLVEPSSGKSILALQPPKEDSNSPAAAESASSAAEFVGLEPGNGAESADSKLQPAVGAVHSLARQPYQPHLQPLQISSNKYLAIEDSPQSPSVPAKDATADAQVPHILELTASHSESAGAVIHMPNVLPPKNQLEGKPNAINLMAKFNALESLMADNTADPSASKAGPSTTFVNTSTSSTRSPTSSTSISDEELEETKKLWKISSNSKAVQVEMELQPLAQIPKITNDSSTQDNITEQQQPEHHDGLVFLQPSATSVNVSSDQPVISNILRSSSKLSQNENANPIILSDTTNTSSSENDSWERESNSSNETDSDYPELSELKNISNAKHFVLSKLPSITSASAVKTQIGDVMEATHEIDPKLVDSVQLLQETGYTKNLTKTPHLPHVLTPNRENLKPAYVNLSGSMPSLLCANAMHSLNLTNAEKPADTSYPQQSPSQLESLDGKMAGKGQNRLSGGIVSYYPLVMVPWVMLSRYPVYTAQQKMIRFPPSKDYNKQSYQSSEAKSAAINGTTTTTPKAWTYQPNTSFSDILLLQKYALDGHYVQLVVTPVFYVAESFAFLPSSKNVEQDSNEKNSPR